MLWATTQHYADFDIQVGILLGKETIEPEDYRAATEFITRIVLSTLGLETAAAR
jgi:TetR/AcrR family transcriptional regulator